MQKYFQKEPKFSGVYSRIKINDGAYVINLDECKSIGTHSIALYLNNNNVTYFDNFGVALIPKENKEFIQKQKYYKKYLWNARI